MTEEKVLECLLKVKSGDKSMELTIGQDGFDTDEWIEAFKANFPTPPEGEYEASFVFEDEEYPLGVYDFHGEVQVISDDDGEPDIPEGVLQKVTEDATNLGITVLGMNIFSNLVEAVAALVLCQAGELMAEMFEMFLEE